MIDTYAHRQSDSTSCFGRALVLLCLVVGLMPHDVHSVSISITKPFKSLSTTATTRSVAPASDATAKSNVTTSSVTATPGQNRTNSTTTVESLIRRANCTDKESKIMRCYYGQCYVMEHPHGRDPPACECLDFYKGPTCRILEPSLLPSQEDPTKPQTIVGIVVPIVALLVTGVVVFIMCRMKTRRAAMCAGGSGRNRHAVVLATAENGEATREMKTEDTPLITSGSSSAALGATADSNPDLDGDGRNT